MSQIIFHGKKEFPSEIIGYSCDSCSLIIKRTEPQDYGWIRTAAGDYCNTCKDIEYPHCIKCGKRFPAEYGKEGFCENCK